MDHRDVSALADELAQCTCEHLPWSDQRVIALELGVGECDLAIDDMVRAAVHGACPVPGHIIVRLHEWLDGYNATACTDPAQLRGYLNRLRCGQARGPIDLALGLRIERLCARKQAARQGSENLQP